MTVSELPNKEGPRRRAVRKGQKELIARSWLPASNAALIGLISGGHWDCRDCMQVRPWLHRVVGTFFQGND